MDFPAMIATRRDAGTHSFEDLKALALGAAKGEIPDYQLAAWLMAAYLNPLDPQETAWLTLAMAESGERLDLSGLPKPWVDKHSTGGVGDKTTLVLLPLLAACGLTVVKMSGRGLGITGGTIDKLSSVPGFRLDLSPEEMKAQANRIGLALTGQTPRLAPADGVLYALRDVTSTVASIPLIVSSILSKKIAGGAETIVLDVKCGSGAFMPSLEAATQLATALVETGERCGVKVKIAISDMDQPLGSAVGNALEVEEARRILNRAKLNPNENRFMNLCVALAGLTLWASGRYDTYQEAIGAAYGALDSGKAAAKAAEWYEAQGASFKAEILEPRPFAELRSETAGWIQRVEARKIGEAVVGLGGGRKTKTDVLDLQVGLRIPKGVGQEVKAEEVLATVFARTQEEADDCVTQIRSAFSVSATPVPETPPILEVI